jgi:rhodanese-related sulfurtransferase
MNRNKQTSKHFPFTLIVAALILVACDGQESTEATVAVEDLTSYTQTIPVEDRGLYTDVSAEGLALMLENKDFPLINVHIPYAGEIEGTDEFIPFDQIETNIDKLPTDKDARIVIYCRSGSMSGISARSLVKLGYTDIWNLDGGMIAWQASGRPLQDE